MKKGYRTLYRFKVSEERLKDRAGQRSYVKLFGSGAGNGDQGENR